MFKALNDAAHAREQMVSQNRELQLLRKQMEQNHNGTLIAILVSAAMISAAVLLQ